MNDDAVLLRRYAEEGSEAAFAELVRRYVDLVYGAALRRTGGDAHRAADVAQQVFITLARQAGKLSSHAVLGAWLHTATRNAALDLMISEQRRKNREGAALALGAATSAGDPDWNRLRPELDAAIDELPDADRAAVVQRFLERRAFAEIGAALQISEDAARMRTDRALDKLRAVLARRGITSTATALGAIVSSQPLVAAPAGLATTLATGALAATATTVAAGTGIATATFLALMTTKSVLTATFCSVIAFAAGAYFGFTRSVDTTPPAPLATPEHTKQIATLRDANGKLQTEIDRLRADVGQLTAANTKLVAQKIAPPPPAAVAPAQRTTADIQKAMLNNLRQLKAAADQFQLENGRQPSLDELVGETKYVRRLNPVDGENYTGLVFAVGQPLTVVTPAGVTVTYDPKGNTTTPIAQVTIPPEIAARLEAQRDRIKPAMDRALAAYASANGGKMPSNSTPEALIPYFTSPQDGADFVEFIEAVKAAQKR